MSPVLRFGYEKVSRNWAVETFAELSPFVASLRQNGFRDITVEDISLCIAPSVMHVPFATLRFLASELWRSKLSSAACAGGTCSRASSRRPWAWRAAASVTAS